MTLGEWLCSCPPVTFGLPDLQQRKAKSMIHCGVPVARRGRYEAARYGFRGERVGEATNFGPAPFDEDLRRRIIQPRHAARSAVGIILALAERVSRFKEVPCRIEF